MQQGTTNKTFYPGVERGFGMIRDTPSEVYSWIKSKDKTVTIVREGVGYDKEGTLQEAFALLSGGQFGERKLTNGTLVTNAYDVLLYFLRVHQEYYNNRQSQSWNNRRHWFTDVICIEVSSYLSAYSEYIMLMYKYLYYNHIYMPELYVIVDYPTHNFDFISTEIFEEEVRPWKPTSETSDPNKIELIGRMYDSGTFTTITKEGSHVAVVISTSNFYEEVLRSALVDKQVFIYDSVVSYLKSKPLSAGVSLIIVRTPDELIDWRSNIGEDLKAESFNPSVIIYDSVIKVPVNMMYAGNVPVKSLPNDDYVKSVIWKCQRTFSTVRNGTQYQVKVLTSHDVNSKKERVVRGVFERSPVIDILLFIRYNVKLGSLYASYYKQGGPRNFPAVIRQDSDVIMNLNLDDKARDVSIRFGIHPVFTSMIKNWFQRGWPKFSILIFVATMTTVSGKTVEIKEPGTREYDNDISQTSRYGQVLFNFLKMCENTGDPYTSEGGMGKTSSLLFKLSETYGTLGNGEYLPDHNKFTTFLITMLNEDYRDHILRRAKHSLYRSSHNTQLNWSIPSTVQAPEYLFPITVGFARTNRFVYLFVPIDRL